MWFSARRRVRVAALAALLAIGLAGPTSVRTMQGEVPSSGAPFEVIASGFERPAGVAAHPAGFVALTDTKAGVLYRLTPTAAGEWARETLFAGLDKPVGLAVEPAGHLLIAERGAGRLVRLAKLNGVFSAVPEPVLERLKQPRWLVLAPDGALYLTAEDVHWPQGQKPTPKPKGDLLLKRAPEGTLSVVADHFKQLRGLAFDEPATLYAVAKRRQGEPEHSRGALYRIALPSGTVTPVVQDRFTKPEGVAVDELGAVFVTAKRLRAPGEADDHDEDEDDESEESDEPETPAAPPAHKGVLLKAFFKTDGTLERLVPVASGLGRPMGLAFDAEGHLYVAERRHGRALRFAAPGPPVLDPLPAITNQATLTVRGTAAPGARITLRGGAEPATGLADATTGAFAVDVSLTPNAEQTLRAYATSLGGDGLTSRAAEATLTHDDVPPDTQFVSGPSGTLNATTAVFTVTGTDTLTPPTALRFAARLDAGPLSAFTAATTVTFTSLTPGPHTVEVVAQDEAGNVDPTPATRTFTVVTGPTITGFSPTSGAVGTAVTITGQNFDAVAANNQVKFNGIAAIITAATTTAITTTVPQTATTGPITVTTPISTATSAGAFTVTKTQDFLLSLLPNLASVAATGSATYQVRVTSTGPNDFTGFVNLSLSGLPAGVTVTLSPPQATVNTVTTVLLNTASAAAGTFSLTVTGIAPIDGTTTSHTAAAVLTVLPAGTSTLSGRVLASKDDSPLANVTIKLGTRTVLTDAGGNFLVDNVPTGPQIVFVDGATASSPAATYPVVPVPVTIVAGQDNVLPWPVFLHEVSTNFTPIAPSVDTIVTDPSLPNFALRIPAGVTIIGWDGQPNTRISVAAVPGDRTALAPLTGGLVASTPYLFYFGKPGGGTPSQPIPVTFPNEFGTEPGTTVDLYYYDESLTPDSTSNQWKKFGAGTVSDDGLQVVSDPGVGIPKFCCGGGRYVPPPPPPIDDNPTTGGDPVVLSTGQLAIEATDLVLPGRHPVVIRRAYRSVSGSFSAVGTLGLLGGQTTLLSYNETLRPSGTQTLAYISGFGQSLLSRQADGTYSNAARPGLRGMIATRNPDGSGQVRLKDGTALTFDTNGRLVERRDRHGNAVTIVRDGSGRITEIREPAGRALTFQYTGAGQISQLTDPLGRTVRYTYDALGRLLQVTNPAGGVTSYSYDGLSRVRTLTDARGLLFLTNEYDGAGRVVKQTQADGGVWQFAYTVTGGVVTQTVVTDPAGKTATHRFNGQGYPLAQTDGQGQRTTFTRNAANQVTATTDAQGRTTRFTYDAAGNTTSITDPDGKVTLFEYEPVFNRVTKITDALGQITTFTYDAQGNLLTTTDPTGATTSIAYNAFGQPTSVTDAPGNRTSFAYDADGNLITTTDAVGNRTQRAYDAVSRLSALTEPRGFTTQFGYDPLNRVTQITDALNGLTAFGYDPNGNLLSVTDANNQTTTYTYDTMDRLAIRKDALNRQETYGYDLNGNLNVFTDRKNQVGTFTYDALNRRTRADYADGRFTTFAYDAMGRLISAMDALAGRIDFSYDVLDRLIQEISPQAAVAYAYDALGRRTTMTVSGLAPVTYQYDAASRLVQVAWGSFVVTIGYDAAGRRISLTYSNGTSTSYTYDAASRVTSINHTFGLSTVEGLTYTYDAAGNRTGINRANGPATLLPQPVTAAYDAANQLIQFNGLPVTHDANGNMTSDGTNTYTWDARNRLIARTGPGLSESFVYDALGRRISKTINGVTTTFLYDGNDIIAEMQGGAITAFYLRGLNIDEPFIRITATGNEYYHTDALGSVLALTNDAGQVTTTYAYEPFGRTQITGTSSNPFQFTGRENDQPVLSGVEGGLYYYRGRYYSPGLQRFISADPIGLYGGDINFYAYVGNNPTTFIDLDGLAKDRSRRRGQEGGRGPLSGSDHIIQDGKEIARKEGGAKGAEHIRKEMERLKLEGNLPNERAAKLRGAAKLLKELGEAAKTGAKIGGLALGILLELADPAEAGKGSDILPGKLVPGEIHPEEAESSRKQ